jgi:hypothetical protein
VLIRERRDCFCMPCSGSGAEFAWMLTAMPLKQGIVAVRAENELVCIIEVRGDRDDDNGERDLKVWS